MLGNKKRIIFWGIVCAIFVVLSISGIVLHNGGYGKNSKVSKLLTPISDKFNSLDAVKRYGDLSSEANGTKIVVTYINTEEKKERYEYIYKNENGIEYITNTYESDTGEFIAKQMVDAMYRLSANLNASIYDLYEYESFQKGTLNDGVNLTGKTISININAILAITLRDKIPSKNDNNVFTEDELSNLKADLDSLIRVSNEKGDIKYYIIDNINSYKVYISYNDNSKQRSLKSLANIIKVLSPTLYDKIVKDGIPDFTITDESYEFIENDEFNEVSFFDENDSIYGLVINK